MDTKSPMSSNTKEVSTNIHPPEELRASEMVELAEIGRNARLVFHDLANHITALTLSIQSLEDNIARDSKRLLEYSQKSEKARITMEYISGMLRSHINNSERSIFSPEKEIKDTTQALQHRIDLHKITVEEAYTPELKIFGNPKAFRHIVTNLLANAIDSLAESDRERKIWIETSKIRSNFNLSVTDNGPGISRDLVGKIFEHRFTTKANGNGIGLFATKDCVERLFGGKISIQSSKERTRFTVKVPIKRKQEILSPVFLDKPEPISY